MIPYQGCKESIAAELLQAIPAAEHFCDLFGGGGSVTECATLFQNKGILGDWRKWGQIHYNELNKGVYELNKAVWSGTFDFEKARNTWISRERFFAEKDLPTAWGAYVRFIWSFGNKGETYIYGKDLELAKQLMHAIIMDDGIVKGDTPRERRLALKKICKRRDISELQSLESMERLQSLERLQRLERLQSMESVACTNLDYRDVPIGPGSVAYCDIPYDTKDGHRKRGFYGVSFDFPAFHEWAATREFPVYFSEYACADSRFKLVWEKEVCCRMTKKDGKGIFRTERLFFNGVKL